MVGAEFGSGKEEYMRPTKILLVIGLVSAGLGLLVAAHPARADACFDLWVQRNSIYKAYGYCFKTPKAINYFGNAGCLYDNEAAIPMSHADKQRVLNIKAREKQLGCL
jgi:YARHG domain